MTEIKQELWTRHFITISLAALMAAVSLNGLSNGIPLYISSIGGAAQLSGVMTSAFAFAAIFGRLLGGNLSDRIGRRRVILAGGGLFCLTSFLPVLLPGTGVLVVFRALHGLSFASLSTAMAAAAADLLPRDRLGEGIGYYGLSQSLAAAAGPAAGIALFGAGGHDALFTGAGASVLVSLVLAFVVRYEGNRSHRAGGDAAPATPATSAAQPEKKPNLFLRIFEKNALVPALMMLLYSLASAILLTYAALCATQRGYRFAGLFFTLQAAAMVLTRLSTGRLFDRLPALNILLPVQLVGFVAFLLLALTKSEPIFYACGFLYGLSFGTVLPLLGSVAVKKAPRERWGAANATFYISCDVGIGLGALLWGALIDASHTYTVTFLGGAACMVLVAAVGILTLRTKKPSFQKTETAGPF